VSKPDGSGRAWYGTAAHVAMRNISRLTVKLRGRPEAPDQRRGRILSSRARGAIQTTHHGPLQRLLGVPPCMSARFTEIRAIA